MTIVPSLEFLDVERKPSSVAGKIYRLDGVLYFEDTPIQESAILPIIVEIQSQLALKAKRLHIEYITGTAVLSNSQDGIIIDSQTDCNIFLPIGVNDQAYRIKNVGPGRVTFVPNGTNTVEKASSFLLLNTNAFDLVFYSNNWYIF